MGFGWKVGSLRQGRRKLPRALIGLNMHWTPLGTATMKRWKGQYQDDLQWQLSQQDILDALAMVSGIRALLDADEGTLLVLARKREISHARVAEALGLKSRQAAEQRLIKRERGSTVEEESRLDRQRRKRLKMDCSPSAVGREARHASVTRAVERSRSVRKEG
jgi:hypothetical protein